MRRHHVALLLGSLLLASCNLDLFDPFGTGSYDYDVRLPANYGNTARPWPVLVFLHGAGGLSRNYIADYATYADSFPIILITPHTKYAWESDRLDNVLKKVEDKYRVDSHRIYVTGFSMGAHGTFNWIAKHPGNFAAAVMVAGAGAAGHGCDIKTVPAWFIHNQDDPTVPQEETDGIVAELQTCGGEVVNTLYENPPWRGTHDAWTTAYKDPAVYAWLLRHSK